MTKSLKTIDELLNKDPGEDFRLKTTDYFKDEYDFLSYIRGGYRGDCR
ncbi:hypothetical protein ES705_49672 [subsurface metagenome]